MASIDITHGSEGPRHDSYAWQEITVHRTSPGFTGSVTIHEGLGEWLVCRPAGRAETFRYDGRNGEHVRRLFGLLAGVTPGQAVRAFEQKHDRRLRSHPCGTAHLERVAGFPGETLLCCRKCGDVLGGSFDRSSIE